MKESPTHALEKNQTLNSAIGSMKDVALQVKMLNKVDEQLGSFEKWRITEFTKQINENLSPQYGEPAVEFYDQL